MDRDILQYETMHLEERLAQEEAPTVDWDHKGWRTITPSGHSKFAQACEGSEQQTSDTEGKRRGVGTHEHESITLGLTNSLHQQCHGGVGAWRPCPVSPSVLFFLSLSLSLSPLLPSFSPLVSLSLHNDRLVLTGRGNHDRLDSTTRPDH